MFVCFVFTYNSNNISNLHNRVYAYLNVYLYNMSDMCNKTKTTCTPKVPPRKRWHINNCSDNNIPRVRRIYHRILV